MTKQRPTRSYYERLMNDWGNRQLPVDVALRESTGFRYSARYGAHYGPQHPDLDVWRDSAAQAINPRKPSRDHNGGGQ